MCAVYAGRPDFGNLVDMECSINVVYIYIHIGMDQYLLIPFLGG